MNERVLVVVDDGFELSTLVPALRLHEMDIIGEARSESMALNLLHRLQPDVVLLDMHIAGISAIKIAVNLRTPLELLQSLVPPMAERGWGRVLTIGSVQQMRPHPKMMVYAGTKAAQWNWMRNLARQFGGKGVTVNNLAPGAILTARNRAQMAVEGAALVERIPAGRLGHPHDLRGAAALLCSDAGAYINGVNLYVDGGRAAV